MTINIPALPASETLQRGDEVITLRPLTLDDLRDNWDLISNGSGESPPETVEWASKIISLSAGKSTRDVASWFTLGGLTAAVEVAQRVLSLSGLELKKKAEAPAGETASP